MEEGTEIAKDTNKIQALFKADQGDRKNVAKNPSLGQEIYLRDQERLAEAREIVETGLPTDPQDLNRLAYIFQHGESIEDYQQALDLATRAVAVGLPPQESLIPQATDRLMIKEQLDRGVPLTEAVQKYGTQTMFDKNGNPVIPKLDNTATKEELEKFGLDKNPVT